MRLIPLTLLCAALATPAAHAAPIELPTVCNGHAELCNRAFDDVSYATTHNAFNYWQGNDPQYRFVNQGFNLKAQLTGGTRALMLDAHYYNGFEEGHGDEVWLCHSFCWLGGQPLVNGLTDIREWMDENPNEVVSIIFESYVDREDVEDAFVDSGLIQYVRAQPVGQPWPTLAQMIATGQRMFVFTDHEGGTSDWYMDVWDYAVETHYSAKQPEDLSCDYNRGDARNDLFILNNFLTYPLARRSLAMQVNVNPFLLDRALDCWAQTGKRPNFVTVDFVTIGDTYETVDVLNGVN